LITFDFDWNGESRGAIGLLESKRMIVTYNIVMALSDFEDAVYRLREGVSGLPAGLGGAELRAVRLTSRWSAKTCR
jgi:hypothetical protein